MIKSMTAFGRAKVEGQEKDITVEIKSVNSRFFDCSVKMPRIYLSLEERIKNYVQKNAVARAKVDIFITVDNHSTVSQKLDIDAAYAESYIEALYNLRDTFGLKDDISVMSVARNQDVFSYARADEDLEEEWELIRSVLDEAIAGYVEMRPFRNILLQSRIQDGKFRHILCYNRYILPSSDRNTILLRLRS